jgi:RNA polymerase sigma factor FliA
MLAVYAGVQAAVREGALVFGDDWIDEATLLAGVLEVTGASNSCDLTTLVTRALGTQVEALTRVLLVREEEALTRSLGLAGRRTRTLEQYLGDALVGTSAGLRARGRKLLARAEATNGIRRRVSDVAGTAMASAPRTGLEEARATLTSEGIDAERLCWAVVAVEARRHVPLVLKEANRAARNWPDRGADGLIGYAWQGLRLALYNYDPERGMFSTYACPRIRGAIRDGIRAESHLPKRLTTFVHKVERARESLTHTLGRHPSLEEVAQSLDMGYEKLNAMRHLGAPVSLNDLVDRDGAFTVVAEEDPEAAAIEAARREDVARALDSIDQDDAGVVRLMVLEGLGVGECQLRTGMSARQLRQRRERGLAALGELLGEWAEV